MPKSLTSCSANYGRIHIASVTIAGQVPVSGTWEVPGQVPEFSDQLPGLVPSGRRRCALRECQALGVAGVQEPVGGVSAADSANIAVG